MVGGVDTGGGFAVGIRITVVSSMGIGVSRVSSRGRGGSSGSVSVVRISGRSPIGSRVQDSGIGFGLTLPAGTGDWLVGGVDAGGRFEGGGAEVVPSRDSVVTSQTLAIVASEAITVT